jgi:hypothetical protein
MRFHPVIILLLPMRRLLLIRSSTHPPLVPPQDLLSTDRLMFAFVVELGLCWLFQGWLVDDDLERRGVLGDPATQGLRLAAKTVPFLGLWWYFLKRPPLMEGSEAGKGQ